MNYRPEGWKNPHVPMQEEPFVDLVDAHFRQIADGKHTAYEAGADAMLEGLRKGAVKLRIADQAINIPGFDIVFIPVEVNDARRTNSTD